MVNVPVKIETPHVFGVSPSIWAFWGRAWHNSGIEIHEVELSMEGGEITLFDLYLL
jgi:hypothetical protein